MLLHWFSTVYHLHPGDTEKNKNRPLLKTMQNANAVIKKLKTLKNKIQICISFSDDDDTCMNMEDSCNCYSKLRFPLQDTIRITDMNKLPVTGFAYGPFTSDNAQAAIRVKELECFGDPPKITRDDCGAVNLKSTNRFQLDNMKIPT